MDLRHRDVFVFVTDFASAVWNERRRVKQLNLNCLGSDFAIHPDDVVLARVIAV